MNPLEVDGPPPLHRATDVNHSQIRGTGGEALMIDHDLGSDHDLESELDTDLLRQIDHD